MDTESQIVLFENVSVMNRERYFEAAVVRGKSWKLRLFAVLAIIGAAYSVMAANMVMLILALIVAVLAMFSNVIIARRDFGKLMKLHPTGEWTKTIRFYEDRIETDSGTGTITTVPYSKIKRDLETNHMYIVDFGQDFPATTMEKNSFTIGTFDEVKQFLLEIQKSVYDK